MPESMMANTAEVKLGICHGCKLPFDHCLDRKYCKICLHVILNYIKEVKGNNTLDMTEFGFYKAYHNGYISQVRIDILKNKGKYKLNPMLYIPTCMIQGSLDDAVRMALGKGTDIIYYLEQHRLFNVEETLQHEAFSREFMEATERTGKKAKAKNPF